MTQEEEKKVHDEAAKLCEELSSLMERVKKENKLEDTEYCDSQVNELNSRYSDKAVIYIIEKGFKPFKVIADDNGKYTICPRIWYNIKVSEPNTLLGTAIKLHSFLIDFDSFLKQNEM